MNFDGHTAFDDEGDIIPITLPFEPAQTLDDILAEHGIEATQDLLDALDNHVEREATRKAAFVIREMLSKLDGTAAAVALRWVVLGVGDEDMRTQAKRIGVSHQAILKAAKLIRKKLGYQDTHL